MRCWLVPFVSDVFVWLWSDASTEVWLINALERGIELRGSLVFVAPPSDAAVAVGDVGDDVTSASVDAILSSPRCNKRIGVRSSGRQTTGRNKNWMPARQNFGLWLRSVINLEIVFFVSCWLFTNWLVAQSSVTHMNGDQRIRRSDEICFELHHQTFISRELVARKKRKKTNIYEKPDTIIIVYCANRYDNHI